MKKVVIIYFAFLSIFILSACGSKGFSDDNASNSKNVIEDKKVEAKQDSTEVNDSEEVKSQESTDITTTAGVQKNQEKKEKDAVSMNGKEGIKKQSTANKTETANATKPQSAVTTAAAATSSSAVSNTNTNKENVNMNRVTGKFSDDNVMNSDEVINANKKK